jgi:hypothetical protein
LTAAALPSLPGTSAQLTQGSFVIDRGEGTRFSAEISHVSTGGAPIFASVLFAQGTPQLTSQGLIPFGTIGGQRQTVFGLRGAFHVFDVADAVVEYGRSEYGADGVAQPGSAKPGNYYHAGLTKTLRRATFAVDLYRNEARYATAILPYGVPENLWPVTWSWPGPWLKSNYQVISSPAGANRQGYRLKYQLDGGRLEVHASYANFGQIDPVTFANAMQTGFVDEFFLPQHGDAATLGRQNQYAVWARWHAGFADLTVDWVYDTVRRGADAAHAIDYVAFAAPEYTMYASRRIGTGALASLGYAQYFMKGAFANVVDNVNFGQRQVFAGAEFHESAHSSTLLSVRRSVFAGYATILTGVPPPDFTSTLVIVEQRIKL